MADKSSAPYIPGTEAAQEYEEAMRLLRESLEARQKPLFDPTFLALAAGASRPTKTGGWGEMLGNVSESLYSEQDRARKQQEQDIASRMELAKFGMMAEQQKQRAKAFQTLRGGIPTSGMQTTPMGGAPASQAPTGGLPSASQTQVSQSDFAPPPGMKGVEGIQVQPPSSSFADRNTYLQMAEFDPSISPAKALETAQEIEKKRYDTKENGVLDLKTGMFYPFPKGETVERRIMGDGQGKSYKVDQRTAALLDLYASTNDPRYFEIADKVLYGPKKPGDEGRQRLPSLSEQAEAEAEAKTAAEARGKLGVESEAALKQRDTAARMLYSNAQDVKNRLAQSSSYFGIFNRPTLMASLGKLINEGVRAGQTNINIAGFEDFVRQNMKGISQKDLDNVAAAAGSLAEVELAFTKLYLASQGAVTEGERAVVRRIPGTVSSSPAVLKDKMDLLSMRAQFDMDIADKYRNWKKDNPGKSYLKFEESDDYTSAVNRFQEQLGNRFGTAPAVPSSQRPAASQAPAARPGSWAQRLQGQ